MIKIVLKGPRVELRPRKLSDCPNFVRWCRDKEVMRFFSQKYYSISLKEEKKFFRGALKSENFYGSIINEQGKHIGGCDFKIDKEKRLARFGIMIGEKSEWGKGYAGECIILVGDYIFKRLELNRLELTVSTDNRRGIRAYKKSGFIKEGTMRKYRWSKIEKRFMDEDIMSILKNEWSKNNK